MYTTDGFVCLKIEIWLVARSVLVSSHSAATSVVGIEQLICYIQLKSANEF